MATVWIVAFGLALLSLILHLTAPSTMRESENGWDERVTYHQTKPSFAVRPLTTSAVAVMHDAFGWSFRSSFFILQFSLLLLCGPALAYWLRQLGFTLGERLLGMGIFYLSLPVLLAHFEPIFTWDDLWVYLFVPLGFAFVVGGRILLSTGCLIAAMLARETSLIFLLPWLILLRARFEYKLWPQAALALAVVGIAGLVRSIWTGLGAGPEYWEWEERARLLAFNFESLARSRDTVFSLLAGLGVLWPVGVYQLFQPSEYNAPRYYDALRIGAVIAILGFTLPTLLFMQARESRLFFPPFVFLIPLALVFLRQHADELRDLRNRLPRRIQSVWPVILWLGGIGITYAIFPEFEYRKWQDGNRAVFGLHVAAGTVFVLLLWRRRQARKDREAITAGRWNQIYPRDSRSMPRSGRRGSP